MMVGLSGHYSLPMPMVRRKMAALQLVEPMLGQNVFSLSALMELPTMAAQKWLMTNPGALP